MKTGRFVWNVMALGVMALGLMALGGMTGCGVDEPPCSFACGPSSACPDDYQCLADGYCHLHGQMRSCGFSDLAAVIDLQVVVPMDAGTDLPLPIDDGGEPAADLSTDL